MLVFKKEDLESIKESIADELKNNPAFVSKFDSNISWALNNIRERRNQPTRHGINIYVSEDGRNIRIREPMTRGDGRLPSTVLRGTDINLREDGSMEVIESSGELFDGKKYYESRSQRMSYRSVLKKNYYYERYDSNGIQTKSGYYIDGNWGLDMNFTYEDGFTRQLYSEGWHMPEKWDEGGIPEEPKYVSPGAVIRGITRMPGHIGIAKIYEAELEVRFPYVSRKNAVSKLGYIRTDSPERINIDRYQIFAETKDGKYEPTELYSQGEYEGKTCDEIMAMIEEKYPEAVKASLENGRYSVPKITKEALKESFKIVERNFGKEK